MEEKMPFVSIIVPCRNEEKFIGKCLESIVNNDYPGNSLEVLVIDGMSEDGTKGIIRDYEKSYLFIRHIENSKRITSGALNIGISQAKGEVIIRMDAHAVYQNNYISKCVKYLEDYKADNVGGAMITLPRENTVTGRAIAAALSSPFGVGNSTFRTGSGKPVWVDTVFGGCYRKEVFKKIGLFNEDLVFSQDMEFNLRLKKAGGKILFHPEIKSYYYTRSDFLDFCGHNFRNGVWVTYPLKFTKTIPFSLRHLIPLFFVLSFIASAALAFFFAAFYWLFICIAGSYIIAGIFFSARIAAKESDLRYFFLMPAVFFSLHFLYGIGSIRGLAKSTRRQHDRFKKTG